MSAFTLRLDEERHLRLRLACVATGKSAQRLTVEALDRALAEIPNLGELVASARKGAASRNC